MKKVYLLAAAALAFAACSNEDLYIDGPAEMQNDAISFKTFAQKATRAAENSNATEKYNLEMYHQTMSVWGYKNVASADVPVFTKQLVENESTASGDWKYTPIRFWDKSADHYKFYAAAPASAAWVFDGTARKLSISNFTLKGISLPAADAVKANAVFPAASGDVDLMISHDITNYKTYTYDAVNLEFDHILSRFNIGVRTIEELASGNASNLEVKLDEVRVFNMVNKGSFNEASSDAIASGSAARWTANGKFASSDAVGYASGDAVMTEDYNYVYQALFIPQVCASGDVKMDGTNVDENSAPYIRITYTISDKNASGDAGETYTYYYNLAKIFNKAPLTFCEGWMNTLLITIDPIAIKFDAQVYEWTLYASGDAQVPGQN